MVLPEARGPRAPVRQAGGRRRGRCRRLHLTGVPHAVAVAVMLVRVRHRRAVVEDVGNLIPVLVLKRMHQEILPTRPGRAVVILPADSVLTFAGASVAELAGRTMLGDGAFRADFDTVAGAREHRGAPIASGERAHQAVEVLGAHVAGGGRLAVAGERTPPR